MATVFEILNSDRLIVEVKACRLIIDEHVAAHAAGAIKPSHTDAFAQGKSSKDTPLLLCETGLQNRVIRAEIPRQDAKEQSRKV